MSVANPALALRAKPASGLVGSRFDPGEMLVDDVTGICQRVRFVEVAPFRLFDVSLISELADASDRLAAKVADLQERQGASR